MSVPKTVPISQVSIEINIADVDNLTKDLVSIIEGKKITTSNILAIVTQLMMVLAKYQNLTGVQKKELLIYVMKKFVEESEDIDEDTKRELLFMFDLIIPSAIDLLVATSKNKFAFKIKKTLFPCC